MVGVFILLICLFFLSLGAKSFSNCNAKFDADLNRFQTSPITVQASSSHKKILHGFDGGIAHAKQKDLLFDSRRKFSQTVGRLVATSIVATLLTQNPGKSLALSVGDVAPSFALPSYFDGEKTLSLESLRGKWVVLYFYPADFTGGCSIEASRFQKSLEQFQDQNAQIVGVSLDDIASHKAFCKDLKLKFPLLADVDGDVTESYESLFTNEYGSFSMRQTFLIDPNGTLRYKWKTVNPSIHADEVLAVLRKLNKS